jgi:hypothetical protein
MAEPPPDWSILLGDVIFNLTSALDHLAWSVVSRGKYACSLTSEEERGVYFPFAFSSKAFSRELDRGGKGKPRLVGARLADSARIRRYQPYQAGKRNAPKHCLAILNECSNRDKHRELTPLWMQSKHFAFQVGQTSDCEVTRNRLPRSPIERIEPGAEFGRVYVRRTGPHPDVYLNGSFSAQIAIYEGVPIKDWLNQVVGCIGSLLREFAEPPSGVIYISEAEWAAWTAANGHSSSPDNGGSSPSSPSS